MGEIRNITEAKDATTTGESLVVELSKEYEFEGEKVKEVDLSGLKDVTAKTMIRAGKVLISEGDVQVLPEQSLHYTLVIASGCTKLPMEFYEMLAPRDASRIKNTVSGFLFGMD